MSEQSEQNNREDIESLFHHILATFKASGITSKVSLCCVPRKNEEWYVLIASTFRMDSLEDFERYQRTHGAITPLH